MVVHLSNNLFLSKNIRDGWNKDKRKINIKIFEVQDYIFNRYIIPWNNFEQKNVLIKKKY